jgi:YHS domain-containing protein
MIMAKKAIKKEKIDSKKTAKIAEKPYLGVETEEVQELDIREGKKDMDLSKEAGREEAMEEDQIDPAEEGFLEGESGIEEDTECEQCKKLLGDEPTEVYEEEIEGELKFFCSNKCADAFKKKKKKSKK